MIWRCWCHVNIRIINDLWLGLIDTANVSHYCDLFIQSCNYITTQHPSIWNLLALAYKEKLFKVHQDEGLCSCWEKSFLIWRRNSCEWWRMKVAALLSSIKCAQSPGFGVTHCVSSSHCYHYHIHHIHHNLHQQSGVSHGEIRFANTIINYTDLNIQETFGMLGGSKFHFHII